MLKTYQFLKKPKYDYEAKEVTTGFEDHFNLMEIVQKWLNLGTPSSTARPPSLPDLRHQVFIGIDQLCMSPTTPTNSRAMLIELASISNILNSAEGQKLGKSPLDFLSKELSKFTSVSQIFASSKLLPRTDIASDFHQACDGVENVVVIIKSGQYIAGGYTEVPFDSHSGKKKPNPKLTSLVFSANRQKRYGLRHEEQHRALQCTPNMGPVFGGSAYPGLAVFGDIGKDCGWDCLFEQSSAYHSPLAVVGELCGTKDFKVDEYEVYKLE